MEHILFMYLYYVLNVRELEFVRVEFFVGRYVYYVCIVNSHNVLLSLMSMTWIYFHLKKYITYL